MDLNIIDTSDWIDTNADPFEIGGVLKLTKPDGTVETRVIVKIEFADPTGYYYPDPSIYVLTFSDGSQLYYRIEESGGEYENEIHACPSLSEDPYHFEIM